VIALGTNDFAKGDPGQPFIDAYTQFLVELRMHYAQARFYLATSPILGSGSKLTTYLGQLVTARAGAGDANMAVLTFPNQASDQWGCGHPNATAHAAMATTLEQALTQDLGW
jgi:hypothetical protein